MRNDRFVEVLRIKFNDAPLHCRFFWRDGDHRARILLTRKDSQHRTLHYCMPMTGLKLVRRNSCLSLNRLDLSGPQYSLWANLYFPIYEHQVLFYCAFLAMKRQNREPAPSRLDDYFPGERTEFSGEIEDDSYLHALRMYRCSDSGAVRLEASARRGPMVGTPIWTAFITEYIGSRRWIRKIAPNVLELEALRPYVFTDGYSPPKVGGRFRLTFTHRDDVEHFIRSFQMLRR